MKKLQPIPTDEQATLKTIVEGKIVHLIFSVKPNGEKGTPRYNLMQNLDFKDVTEAELLELASKPLRIDIQSIWRAAKDRMNEEVWQGRTWMVRDMLDQTRQKADPVQKLKKMADNMTKAERSELMDMLREAE